MIVHYLVIWCVNGNMNTRKETPMDLQLTSFDEESAKFRYAIVKENISLWFTTPLDQINIINICRL